MKEATPQTSLSQQPVINPWLIAFSVMLATFMEVLDTSVANVSLPHIGGTLSATTEESTWVLTSYLVSNAVVMPMTGWLSRMFGRKRLILFCIILFTISSCVCGLAPNLTVLIIARVIQGLGGGALQPTSQAVLLETFPPQKRGSAMAVFSLGIVVAPIVGPTLGGWITDNYSWRWIFLINLPIGLLSLMMVSTFLFDPDHIKKAKAATTSIDYMGLGLMALWITTLQIVLDKGQQEDWLNSPAICTAILVAILAFMAFVVQEFRAKHPIVDLRVFANRNFAIGVVLVSATTAILFGSVVMLPIFLQELMGYTAVLAGIAMSPRGIAAFCTTSVVGKFVGKFDDRFLIAIGFVILGISNFWMGNLNLDLSYNVIILPIMVNGMALSFIFIPLTTTTMRFLANEQISNATGIWGLIRNLGSSAGVSVLITMLVRRAQQHQAYLSTHLTPYDFGYWSHHSALGGFFARATGAWSATPAANAVIYKEMVRQANLMAFVDNFHMMSALAFFCVPMAFLFKNPGHKNVSTTDPGMTAH